MNLIFPRPPGKESTLACRSEVRFWTMIYTRTVDDNKVRMYTPGVDSSFFEACVRMTAHTRVPQAYIYTYGQYVVPGELAGYQRLIL